MSKTLVIGLTGSTGAGKSEVARLLAAHGCYGIDADVLARRAVEPGSAALAALIERFSDTILRKDGTLDRAALAAAAFATEEATAALNAIVHPAVIALLQDELNAARERGERVVVLDVPLLFQTGLETLCDLTVAVIASPAVRCERIRRRDGLTVEQASARMDAQPPDAYYADRADRVIENDGDRERLSSAVAVICREVTG